METRQHLLGISALPDFKNEEYRPWNFFFFFLFLKVTKINFVCLFVLRFYGPVNS